MRPLFRLFRTPFRTPTSLLRPAAPLQPLRFRLQSPLQRRLYSSPSPNPTPHLGSPPSQSLSARLKSLSKEYGWTAVGVYLGLSALDFPFCFLAVRMLGTDRIGFAEDKVVGWFWGAVGTVAPELAGDRQAQAEARAEQEREGQGEDASLWTQLVLAYAVHKSLIFFRVPLTAAVLPKVVKTLRGWGWKIGKK